MSSSSRVLFVAAKPQDQPESDHEPWQRAVRAALPTDSAWLHVEFCLVATVDELRAALRDAHCDILHFYEHEGEALVDDDGATVSPLKILNSLGLVHGHDEAAPRCVILTRQAGRGGAGPAPIPGAAVTLRMSGSLEHGPALAFVSGFYGVLAAGLAFTSAVSEGKASAAREIEDEGEPFEVVMFEAGERVGTRHSPFDELRLLKDNARRLTESIREIQRQLGDSSRLSSGDLLGDRFVLDEHVSSGGFAEIWKAYDRDERRLVAVKILHEAWARDPARLTRYERSALAMDELDHPRIVDVVARVERDHGRRYFAMRWYEHGDLAQAVRRGELDHRQRLLACADALDGLAAAHARKLVHRDVKPGHILVDHEGRGCIADFDLELGHGDLTMLRGVAAPPYAAPELHPRVDAGADVYAAGMCIVFALLGQDPDPRDPLAQLDEAGACSDTLREALSRALAPEPAARTITCEALAEAVRAFVECGPGPEPLRRPWSRQGQDIFGRWAAIDVEGVELRMRWIKPGKFSMGSDTSADLSHLVEGWCRPDPVHTVTLSSGFWLAETECTQALWQAVMGQNPSEFPGPDKPVEHVSWVMAQRFMAKLNQRVGGPPFCLPTEAQWEYACRAETLTDTYGGPRRPLSEIAWYAENSEETALVRQKAPNRWGMHDILGNVWEWCADGPRTYRNSAVVDPIGREGELRVIRGGGWLSGRSFGVRAADRVAVPQSTVDNRVGFRLARYPS